MLLAKVSTFFKYYVNLGTKFFYLRLNGLYIVYGFARTVSQAHQKFCRKATIEDSVSSAEINDIQNLIETLNRKSVVSNSSIQPFIIVVGVDISNLVEFYVSFGKCFYKFNSFIIALDICFKINQVFGLK